MPRSSPPQTGDHKQQTRRAFLLGAGLAGVWEIVRGGAPTARAAPGEAIPIVPGTSLGIVPRGGAGGGDALYLNGGDFIGPRNLQGGGPGGQNFDIGAGSTEDPSDIALNWDIGRRTLVYDGKKNLLASFGPDGIKFFRKVQFVRGQFPRKHRPGW